MPTLTIALAIGIVLLVAFFLVRIVLKVTHIAFTVGCLAIIVLAVLFVLFGGLPLPVR
jgi:hypothetical protein